MKKIFLVFVFSLLLTQNAFAQTVFETDAQCAAAGGDCNSFWNSCEDNQTKLGICIGSTNLTLSSACCANNSGAPNPDAEETEDGLEEDGTVSIIGRTLCTRPLNAGGWGGVCEENSFLENVGGTFSEVDACNDFGDDAATFVGLCNPSADSVDASMCCVPKGTAIANPTLEQIEGQLVTTNYCTSVMGGKCEDIDNPNFGSGLRGIGVDIQDATCDSSNEVVVSLCTDNSFLTWDMNDQRNGCCVPKDGPYCRQLQQQNNGEDICRTRGAGGSSTSIQYGDYQLLEQIPGSSNTSGSLQPYLESIYKAGFILIVLGAVFMIGVGGFVYMASAGNSYAIKKGKGMITDALIGLIAALFIWLLLNIINPDLVNLQIDPLPGLSFDSSSTGTGADAPADGEGQAGTTDNCIGLGNSQLRDFPAEATNGETEKARPEIVESFLRMREAARADGINLKVNDGYRAPGEQEQIWNSHNCRIVSGRNVCQRGAVARPCSLGGGGSNHGSGYAIDISVGCGNGTTGCNTPTYRWLQANGGRFGFYNRIANDPPHWSPTGR